MGLQADLPAEYSSLQTHQLFAEVVPKLADEVHEAVEGVRLGMLGCLFVRVSLELEVDGGVQLVHALHVSDARVELGIDEESPLAFLQHEAVSSQGAVGTLLADMPAVARRQCRSLCKTHLD